MVNKDEYIIPPLATCKISSRSDDPSPRYQLPNLVDFLATVTHKKYPQNIQYSKWYVFALHAATDSLTKLVEMVNIRQDVACEFP